MNTYNRSIMLFSIVLLASSWMLDAHYIDGYDQLKNYVEQCTAQFFYPKHEQLEVRQLQQEIVRKINRNFNEGFFYSYYDQSKVEQAIVDELVNYVSDKAYSLKGDRARTFIRKELIDRISHMAEIPLGFFADYIGQSLRDKLAYIPTHEYVAPKPMPKPAASVSPQNIYPSENCCVCLETFSDEVEEIFFVPCGHDMCKDCCKSYFFDYNNKNCPTCRAVVNLQSLREAIFS